MQENNSFKQKITPIIGFEVHIELGTESKMFCATKADHFGREPNTQTCPICLGLPGALPFPNKKAVEWTMKLGLALGCSINPLSKFDRKNYFYPDLPKGYQISQYDLPMATAGNLEIETESGFKKIRIKRVHLEEDTAKLAHVSGQSLIDFNRAGVPLVEIVTEPDFSTSYEAKSFLQSLQTLVRYLEISEADMEKGHLRCEPNVNLKIIEGKNTYYTPIVEIKNINSFRFVQRAIDYEIERQALEFNESRIEISPGNKTTRGWDEEKGVTFLQRGKEEAEDYRYFPEPDIPPMSFIPAEIENLKREITELPSEKIGRFQKDYQVSNDYAKILVSSRNLASYFEEAVKYGEKENIPASKIANILINKKIDISQVKPEDLILSILKEQREPKISDEDLEKVGREVILENPEAVEAINKGKLTAIEFLVGQVMRKTQGKADSKIIREIIQNLTKTT